MAQQNVLTRYPDYEATIGIEVHVQLKTKSKVFCSCKNEFGQQPNTNICQICAGHPGTLPALNKKVVDYAIMAGLATNCQISQECEFARKHYMYPDLPKNYQTTQAEPPICTNGFVPIQLPDGSEKKIHLTRIHIEEDAGKNMHTSAGYSLVDLNRAGSPLLEIVTEPDMTSSLEAKLYLTRLHSIVRYLGISDANMEEGSFRADINVSVRKKGETKLGTRIELKNINSFRFVVQAIEYEIERHIDMLESGEEYHQETRVWDNKNQRSIFMRSKESIDDYRYLPDPDLAIIKIDQAWIERIKADIPELPHHKFKRFTQELGLGDDQAETLVQEKDIALFFEETVELCGNAKTASNLILRDLLSYLKENKLSLEQTKMTPQNLASLVGELDNGSINSKVAQEVFVDIVTTGKSAPEIIKEKDLGQIDDVAALEAIVADIIKANQDSVQKYQSGNERVFGFFVGQAMKATKGKGNPQLLNDLLKKHLAP
ncbi:MAG: Asp-tRNA(Asn)/Glu-tRNA(Gln) amidotransferase subunit GatB [Epsilonproteobacteria bacterium]|nr:Asp-tRNA(Asn)/Glu-tRNA(Gln) amidotransferase subunit GatB [Campylobacterota bacterium]